MRNDRCARHQETVEFELSCVPCLIEGTNEQRTKVAKLRKILKRAQSAFIGNDPNIVGLIEAALEDTSESK